MENSLVKNGYKIIRNAIPKKLIRKLQIESLKALNGKSSGNLYKNFNLKLRNNLLSEYEFVKPINENLINKKIISEILFSKKILNFTKNLIGSDLAYLDDNVITINTKKKASNKLNYHFKEWHQEIWSGADISTLIFWLPIFQKNSLTGQIAFIKGSNKWGHIPHRNREPLNLPKKYSVYKTNLNLGDVACFTSLTLHRTIPTEHNRLGLPILVRNFKYQNNSFEKNKNWKIFSYSDLTKIERYLGNHFLSPYRIIDQDVNLNDSILKNK